MQGSVSVTTSAVTVVNENANRIRLIMINNNAANTIWVGQGGATTSSGVPIFPKCSLVDERDNKGYIYRGSWVAISDAAGPSTLTYIEEQEVRL